MSVRRKKKSIYKGFYRKIYVDKPKTRRELKIVLKKAYDKLREDCKQAYRWGCLDCTVCDEIREVCK